MSRADKLQGPEVCANAELPRDTLTPLRQLDSELIKHLLVLFLLCDCYEELSLLFGPTVAPSHTSLPRAGNSHGLG
jgi:hypothetical protein